MSRTEFRSYQLWRRAVGPVRRLAFASHDERRRTGRLVAPLAARQLTHSKLATRTHFAARGLAMPQVLATFGCRHAEGEQIADRESLRRLLADAPGDGVVLKSDGGMQGADVVVLSRTDGTGGWQPDGVFHSLETLWERMTAPTSRRCWLAERRLRRDPRLPVWAGDLLSTIRFFTVFAGGAPRVHAATLKIPLTTTGTDNLSRGNLGAPVALQDGRLGAARTIAEATRHAVHPVTGAPIAGVVIPDWHRAMAVAVSAAEGALPLRVVGWDVALTHDGPLLLEGNVLSAEWVVQGPQDEGLLRGWYLALLHEVGAEASLTRRRWSAAWRHYEAAELARCLDAGVEVPS